MHHLEIYSAKHGGYIVMPSSFRGGDFREPLFAGTLPEALEYMRKTLSDAAVKSVMTDL